MLGGQEKNFSTLGPKLRGNKAQQYYGDKQRQIRIEVIDYLIEDIFVTVLNVSYESRGNSVGSPESSKVMVYLKFVSIICLFFNIAFLNGT